MEIKQNRKLIVKGLKAQLCLLKQIQWPKKTPGFVILSRFNLTVNIYSRETCRSVANTNDLIAAANAGYFNTF